MAGRAYKKSADAELRARSRPARPKRAAAGGRDADDEGLVVKIELYGNELTHKKVSASGACGRVYLPLTWVGKKVKIIRVD